MTAALLILTHIACFLTGCIVTAGLLYWAVFGPDPYPDDGSDSALEENWR